MHNGLWCGEVGESRSYQPYTATGKLNADITPTTPRGFGTMGNLNEEYYRPKSKESIPSRMVCPGRSELTIRPSIILDSPTA
jgi:hypothetical protein